MASILLRIFCLLTTGYRRPGLFRQMSLCEYTVWGGGGGGGGGGGSNNNCWHYYYTSMFHHFFLNLKGNVRAGLLRVNSMPWNRNTFWNAASTRTVSRWKEMGRSLDLKRVARGPCFYSFGGKVPVSERQKRTPTRCVEAESRAEKLDRCRRGLFLQLMLRLHAALRWIRTLLRLDQWEEFVFWFNWGIIYMYKAHTAREREEGGRERDREGGRERGRGGATGLSVSFVAIGPSPLITEQRNAHELPPLIQRSSTVCVYVCVYVCVCACACWRDFTAACLHYPYTIIPNDPYSLNWKLSV